jgi:putative DNA primase/helicase
MVKGCLEWAKDGLKPPSEVLQATKEYQEENDKVMQWINSNCVLGPDKSEKSGVLYRNFKEWATNSGEKTFISQNKFSERLTKKGFVRLNSTGNYPKFYGVGLLDKTHTDTGFEGNKVINFPEPEKPF